MADIRAVLTASVADFQAKMAEADASVKGLQESGSSNFSKLQTIGKGALLGVGAAVGVVAVASVELASKFQSTVTSIAANANISQSAAQKIGQAFLNTAGTTIYSGQQIGQAYASVAGQLGAVEGHALTSSQAMTVMKAAMDLAEGSGTDLNTSTTVLASTMQAFGLKSADAGKASDVLFNTSRVLGTGISSVGGEFTKLHSTLGAVTPSLGDLGGILIDLTEHGETGRKALSAVNTSLNGLLVPTKAAKDAQDLLGVSFVNSQGQFVGMSGVISQLQPKLAGMSQEQQLAALKAIGMGTANKALLTTILAGPGAYDKATASASRLGEAHEAAEKQSQTFQHQVELLKTQFEDYGTELGEKLIPILEKVASTVAKVVEWFTKHKTAAEAVGIAIAVLVAGPIAAYIAGMAVAAAETVIAAAPFLLIVAAAVAVGAAVYEIINHWSSIVKFFQRIWQDIKNWFDDGVRFIRTNLGTIAPIIATLLLGPIGGVVALIATHWNTIKSDVSKMVDAVVGFFTALPGQIVAALGDIVSTIWAPFGAAASWVDSNVIVPVVNFFTALPGQIVAGFGAITTTIWQGLTGAAAWVYGNVILPVWNMFAQLPGNIFRGLGDFVGTIFNDLLNAGGFVWNNVVVPVWNNIMGLPGSLANGLSGFIGDIFSQIGDVGQWVYNNIVQPIVNTIKNIPADIGNLGSSILNDITGGFHIPGLAVGGVVTSPTIAMIGEAGPEAVIPLNDTQRALEILGLPKGRATQGSLTGISSVPAQPAPAPSGAAAPMQINLVINGQTFAQATWNDWLTNALQNKRSMVTLGLS